MGFASHRRTAPASRSIRFSFFVFRYRCFSLKPQCLYRIDPRRAACWHPGRERGACQERRRKQPTASQGRALPDRAAGSTGAATTPIASTPPSTTPARQCAMPFASTLMRTAPGRRAHRHANADFARAQVHEIADDRIQPEHREHERQPAEPRQHRHHETAIADVRLADLIERADVIQRNIGIDTRSGRASRGNQLRRIAVRFQRRTESGHRPGSAQTARTPLRPLAGWAHQA